MNESNQHQTVLYGIFIKPLNKQNRSAYFVLQEASQKDNSTTCFVLGIKKMHLQFKFLIYTI